MILKIIISTFLGIILGIFTGLTPGIHINLISTIIISQNLFSIFEPLTLAIIICSMSITHTFLDFIPSIFLGAPDEESSLSVLPGHKMLLKGRGYEAVNLTIIGSTIAIMIFVLLIPLLILLIPKIYPFFKKIMPLILVWVIIFLITAQKEGKLRCIIITIASGIFGFFALNSGIKEPLLPLFIGLFGTSTILVSISKNPKIPKQIISKKSIKTKDIIKPTISTALISPFCSFMPGLGSSQAATISSSIFKMKEKQFLILLGSINTLVMAVSILTLYSINKSRTGTAKAISQIIKINNEIFVILVLVILFSSIISIILTKKIARLVALKIDKVSYKKVSISIIFFVTMVILAISGIQGLIIYISSTILGITCIKINVPKHFLMSVLLIPTIVFYLPI